MTKVKDMVHEMWVMISKYCPNHKSFRQYNLRKDKDVHIDFHEVNTLIRHLKPKQAIVIRFYDYADVRFKEDAYVVIKSYTQFTKRRFSFKVFYSNSYENEIQPMMVECLGHSYELKYNDESSKHGMRWYIRNAIENTLHMCYTHIYDFCMLPTVTFDDTVVSNTLDVVDKFIDKAAANDESPRSQKFVPLTRPNSSVTVFLRPSCANILVKENGKEPVNYPLFPIAFRDRVQITHSYPIFKLVNQIMIMAYVSGLYRRTMQTMFTLFNSVPIINRTCYVLQNRNPEIEEVTLNDYTVENLTMKFVKKLQEILPFVSNLFRFEYAFHVHGTKPSLRYTLGIGIVAFKDFTAIYAYETNGHSNTTSYGKVITRNSRDMGFDFIREFRAPDRSGISAKMIVDKVRESVREWIQGSKNDRAIELVG